MTDFNPDEFIAGIRTAQTKVTIFKRADLAGELIAVEEDLAAFGEDENGGEQDLAAGAEKAELIEKQERLQAELEDSAVEFIVQALEQDKIEEISKEARAAARERADKAAKEAAGYAREECKRGEVTDPKEIKEAVRRAAANASGAILQREAGIYLMSYAVVSDTGERVFTPEQMRQASEKLGAPQMNKLQGAFYDLTSTDPGSFIPKSSKHGKTDGD
ncbi:hypothetical protein [Brevibacterium casei]|uniref:Phage protein n=1 Tax=Brevibacterium casei TaxID=33889 RepID=A0AB34XRE3_9MICO|nr:hypothetical protein [Brevibacterium casei]KZE19168.1 hypothetical protein AVW13_11980 [Brevibacterium casei]